MNLKSSNGHAVQKEFLCMSATRYKFISVVEGRHVDDLLMTDLLWLEIMAFTLFMQL